MPPAPILSQADEPSRADRASAAGPPLRVVLAPNAFKGSMTATRVAAAMAEGVRDVAPDAVLDVAPIADGGDGTVDAFVAAGYTPIPVTTRGPTGDPVRSFIAARGDTVVVELASTCGMALLPGGVPAPLSSTTSGLGDAILAALDHGARDLLVCLGGSASTDGGTGLLTALGATVEDPLGRPVAAGGSGLADIARIDLSGLDPRLAATRITVAVDVSSPLCGPTGAAAMFAPQKGASPTQVAELDAGLRSWSRVLTESTGRDVADLPGAGAAGGSAAALLAVFDATVAPGASVIADLVGLAARLESADVIITGEGRLDQQSALGKGAIDVAARAFAAGVPTLAVCGRIDLPRGELAAAGFAGWADCVSRAEDEARSVARGPALVREATAAVVAGWLRNR